MTRSRQVGRMGGYLDRSTKREVASSNAVQEIAVHVGFWFGFTSTSVNHTIEYSVLPVRHILTQARVAETVESLSLRIRTLRDLWPWNCICPFQVSEKVVSVAHIIIWRICIVVFVS